MNEKILVFEDQIESRTEIVRYLKQEEGFAVCEAGALLEAERLLTEGTFDAVILSIGAKHGGCFSFFDAVRQRDPYLPVIAVAGATETALAVEAMRRGAEDVLPKPVDLRALLRSLKKALAGETRRQARAMKRRPLKGGTFFVAGSPASERLMKSAAAAAADERPLLITGETGTGKGLLARWIHEKGGRPGRRFAGVTCSGLASEILFLELFGPTLPGAVRSRRGLLAEVGCGTLFLDEIGDMALEVQRLLLLHLKETLGQKGALRLISSSNRELSGLVRRGQFLQELLGTIKVLELRIPPLKERLEELPALVRYLLTLAGTPDLQVSEGALTLLTGYHWPGNVQELKNALEQGVLLSRGERLEREHFAWLGRRPCCRR